MLPLVAGAAIIDLVDSTLVLHLGRKGMTPQDFLIFSLLFLEGIERSSRPTLGSLLLTGIFFSIIVLEVTIYFFHAVAMMDEPVLFVMVINQLQYLPFLASFLEMLFSEALLLWWCFFLSFFGI
jgi:hypothetical protein